MCFSARLKPFSFILIFSLLAWESTSFATPKQDEELIAAAYIGRFKQVKVLLAKGANPNTKDKYGWTPLHWAAMLGHTSIVDQLIKRNADPNAQDGDKWTPLYFAAKNGRTATVKKLIEKGADIYSTDRYRKNALYWAKRNGHYEIAAMLRAGRTQVNSVQAQYSLDRINNTERDANATENVIRELEYIYGKVNIGEKLQKQLGKEVFSLLAETEKLKLAFLKHLNALINDPTLANSETNQRIENFLDILRSFLTNREQPQKVADSSPNPYLLQEDSRQVLKRASTRLREQFCQEEL
jgi:hypothetical protein